MTPSVLLVLLGTLTCTSYRSVSLQTDSSPYYTSIGQRVHPHGIAVSKDLLCPLAQGRKKVHDRSKCLYRHKIHYGDWLYVESYGLKNVNDCMNARHFKRVDLWVSSHKEEKAVGTRKVRIYALQIPN